MKKYNLKYKNPATTWYDALPIGNGKIGAMIFSGIKKEKIGLNLDTLWSGYGNYKGKNIEPFIWNEVKKSLINKDYDKAEKIIKDEVLCDWTDGFLPAGDINISFDDISENTSQYSRELSINEAIHKLNFVSEDKIYTRETFTSFDKNVLIIKLSAKDEHSYIPFSFSINMTNKLKHKYEYYGNEKIFLTGIAPSYVAPNYFDCNEPIKYEDGKGIKFALGLKIIQDSGKISNINNKLVVSSNGETYIIFSGSTDFDLHKEYKSKVWEDINEAEEITYNNLKLQHITKYKEFFDRVELTLSDESFSENKQTLELFNNFENKSPYLYELMFHYARYLMISSSMEGSECANLQGIWNKDIRPPWSSNYTVNINTQMNYWFTESVNLPECHMPLFDLMERAKKQGEKTAKNMYNSNGWVTHHNIDIWGHSTPVGKGSDYDLPQSFAMWQMSSGWLCRHLWEHYLHSLDINFLKDRAYPLIKGAVDFYMDNIVEINGQCGLIPSTSPENIFIAEDEKKHALSYFSSMDIGILKDLFSYYLEMCEILNIKEDKRVKSTLEKLPDFKINNNGCFSEWYFDYKEDDEHHRHVSHLYGLYPANIIYDNNILLEAAKNSLNRRGDEGTGWAIAWRACLWARLKDGDRAFSLLTKQLKLTREDKIMMLGGGTYPNLFCAHPPFQIDGNFGFAAAVVEMLVQSHSEHIELLPALPHCWKNGEIKGLILRGGYKISFKWKDYKVIKFNIISKNYGKVKIKFNNTIKELSLTSNKTYEWIT